MSVDDSSAIHLYNVVVVVYLFIEARVHRHFQMLYRINNAKYKFNIRTVNADTGRTQSLTAACLLSNVKKCFYLKQ